MPDPYLGNPFPVNIYAFGNIDCTQSYFSKLFFNRFHSAFQEVDLFLKPTYIGNGKRVPSGEKITPAVKTQVLSALKGNENYSIRLNSGNEKKWKDAISSLISINIEPSFYDYQETLDARARWLPEFNLDLRKNFQKMTWYEEILTQDQFVDWDYFYNRTSLGFDLAYFLHSEMLSEFILFDDLGEDYEMDVQFDVRSHLNLTVNYNEKHQKFLSGFFDSLPIAQKIRAKRHLLPEELKYSDFDDEYDFFHILQKHYFLEDILSNQDKSDLFSYALHLVGSSYWIQAFNINTDFGRGILTKIKNKEPLWIDPDITSWEKWNQYPHMRIYLYESCLLIWRVIPTHESFDFFDPKSTGGLYGDPDLPPEWRPQSQVGYDYSQFELINQF